MISLMVKYTIIVFSVRIVTHLILLLLYKSMGIILRTHNVHLSTNPIIINYIYNQHMKYIHMI